MNFKLIVFILSIALFFSCKEEKKNNVTENKITTYEVKDITLVSGAIQRVNDFPSKFIQPRNVDIWLPSTYSKDKKYAVLYMHDGQMLFDATTTWNKQEWMVDEIASQLMKEGTTKDFIVVALWNIERLRNPNYFPEKVFNSLSRKDRNAMDLIAKEYQWENLINSDSYLKFIVKELKPFVDSNYSTLMDKDNTFVMGSSRGGLISLYAISEYPEVFGGAACLSTHWIGTYSNEDNQIPVAFLEYMDNNLPDSKTHKMYFDYGTKTLDSLYLPYQDRVTDLLLEKGYTKNLKFEGANHSENSWSQRLDIPLTFLLGKPNE